MGKEIRDGEEEEIEIGLFLDFPAVLTRKGQHARRTSPDVWRTKASAHQLAYNTAKAVVRMQPKSSHAWAQPT